MNRTLRLLNIEDSERDIALLRHHLSRAGYDLIFDNVETPAAMKAALETREWHVILCDYSMPQFNALAAYALDWAPSSVARAIYLDADSREAAYG
jgi:CheY-like chemotaxis protein